MFITPSDAQFLCRALESSCNDCIPLNNDDLSTEDFENRKLRSQKHELLTSPISTRQPSLQVIVEMETTFVEWARDYTTKILLSRAVTPWNITYTYLSKEEESIPAPVETTPCDEYPPKIQFFFSFHAIPPNVEELKDPNLDNK